MVDGLRLRQPDGLGRRAGGAGPRPDDRVAAELLQDRDRQALEAWKLDPARDRPGRPARDAAPDDALLRAARKRRQARHAARAEGGTEPERLSRAGAHAAGAEARRHRPCGAPGRPEGAVGGHAPPLRDVLSGVRQLPRLDRGEDGHRGEGRLAARLPRLAEPVVVVRLRPDERREARGVRRDRERRPRRDRRRARRRTGLRLLLPRPPASPASLRSGSGRSPG